VSPKSSLAVVARKDRNINTLKDLEGKRLALTAGDSLTPAILILRRAWGKGIDKKIFI